MKNAWCEGDQINIDDSPLTGTTSYVHLDRSINMDNDMKEVKEELLGRRKAAWSAYVFLKEVHSTTIQLFQRPINISVQKGVRQGDTISPKLLTAVSQWVMKLDWDDKGICVDGKFFSNIRFADDIVIFSTTRRRLC
ncbi:unnamed protein product [Heligmosomoides polygyrus]|uniref:Reverse transcriptase domain-containing protein n=1 Tax=Heligmosomoides polygyrus TaxID=6339 RepID=A0A183G1A1_HELPZ|nr:unnamed protein product [Heligmosomoides polygyrus]